MLGWCSWLSRVPHTHEVASSILASSIFGFGPHMTSGGISSLGRAVGSQSAGRGIETPILHFFCFGYELSIPCSLVG